MYQKDLEELLGDSGHSRLSTAIVSKNKATVKQLLEDSNYDLCNDVSRQTRDTCIHTACRSSSDI